MIDRLTLTGRDSKPILLEKADKSISPPQIPEELQQVTFEFCEFIKETDTQQPLVEEGGI